MRCWWDIGLALWLRIAKWWCGKREWSPYYCYCSPIGVRVIAVATGGGGGPSAAAGREWKMIWRRRRLWLWWMVNCGCGGGGCGCFLCWCWWRGWWWRWLRCVPKMAGRNFCEKNLLKIKIKIWNWKRYLTVFSPLDLAGASWLDCNRLVLTRGVVWTGVSNRMKNCNADVHSQRWRWRIMYLFYWRRQCSNERWWRRRRHNLTSTIIRNWAPHQPKQTEIQSHAVASREHHWACDPPFLLRTNGIRHEFS